MAKEFPTKLKAYELRDGAYGMYLAIDGLAADVDFGSFVYMKKDVDERIMAMENQFKTVNKHLRKLRQKYSLLCQSHIKAVNLCKELMTIMEATK